MANAEAILKGIEIAGKATESLTNTASGIAGLIWGTQDRQYQRYLNELSQNNWKQQFDFAKAQANQQQANFEANRIGNLTKEYTEAGLNPLLAAGMGQSTASVIGSGGSAHFTGTEAATRNMQSAMQQMAQIGKLSEIANIKKTQAETGLLEAQAETERQKLEPMINEIKSRTNLNEISAELSKANISKTQIETLMDKWKSKLLAQEYVNSDINIEKMQLECEELKKKIENLDVKNEAIRNGIIKGWFDSTIGKFLK